MWPGRILRALGARLPDVQLVRVSGPSMVPTLRDGSLVLVRYGVPVRPGDIVLASFADLPGRPVLKRAVAPSGDGWEVRSDNEFAGGDSRTHGPATVHARVVVRLPARVTSSRRG